MMMGMAASFPTALWPRFTCTQWDSSDTAKSDENTAFFRRKLPEVGDIDCNEFLPCFLWAVNTPNMARRQAQSPAQCKGIQEQV